jgi:adenosylcobinamide kinase/adenosylcobinamide-phosphate guanylyltransferase
MPNSGFTTYKQSNLCGNSRKWDSDFQNRIDRHQKDRDERWTNIEEEKYLSKIDFSGKVALIDCVTLWLTNFFVDHKNDVDLSLEEAKEFLSLAEQKYIAYYCN